MASKAFALPLHISHTALTCELPPGSPGRLSVVVMEAVEDGDESQRLQATGTVHNLSNYMTLRHTKTQRAHSNPAGRPR